MTFIEKFDYLKETYAANADKEKLSENFAAQIEMTDDDCHGTFYAACFNGELSVEPYNYYDNSVAIVIDSNLLEEFLTGKKEPTAAYLAGEFSANGNLEHALMLISALKKEPAVKKAKPAAKETKTVAKKPATKPRKTTTVRKSVKES